MTAILASLQYGTAQEATPTLTTLHNFAGPPGDGAYPYASVVIDGDGALFGVSVFGGASGGTGGDGALFSLKAPKTSGASWTEGVLHNFNGGDPGYAAYPYGTLVIGGAAGGHPVLYGTTSGGGSTGLWGTVFSLTPPQSAGAHWTATTLYVFSGGSDGAYPVGGVVVGAGGVLYGTTSAGGIAQGASGYGTVFCLTPPALSGGAWTETVLYTFKGGINGPDGAIPEGGVTIGSGSSEQPVLYGTTFSGGTLGYGAVFSLQPPTSGEGGAWTETVLHNFAGGVADGFNPNAGVAIGSGGVLYGTTESGGAFLLGAVFSLTPPASGQGQAWTETVLYSFAGGSDGAYADAGVAIGGGGTLYGTTYNGGTSGRGTVFALSPPSVAGSPWTERVLHSFLGGGDGANPEAAVAIYGRTLYGTTFYGGTSGFGTVFSLTP
ncbi:MAG: choice-of-anchor tandem repeat GloVer-containing protein [Bryobacteraceae bacterium]